MIIVQKARKEDFEDFVGLYNQFVQIYRSLSRHKIRGLSKQELSKEFGFKFGKDKFFYFARDGKLAVGYIFGYVERSTYGDYGYIDDIFVSRPYQGKGISLKLKDAVLEDFKKKGIKYCRIDVNPENKKAIERYMEWGFVVDKFRMTKKI